MHAACPQHNRWQVTHKVTLIETVALPSFSLSTERGEKKVLNGNSHSPRLYLLSLLHPEEWEEPTGRSFHSALTVVILEGTWWETDRRMGGWGSCVVVDTMREGERIEGQTERNACLDPYYLLREAHVFSTVYPLAVL